MVLNPMARWEGVLAVLPMPTVYKLIQVSAKPQKRITNIREPCPTSQTEEKCARLGLSLTPTGVPSSHTRAQPLRVSSAAMRVYC